MRLRRQAHGFAISRKGLRRIPEVEQLLHRTGNRTELADKFVLFYRRYCWPVRSVDDLKLAPFHPLAAEGKFHTSRDHRWHMETLAGLCAHGAPLLVSTYNKVIDLTDPKSESKVLNGGPS